MSLFQFLIASNEASNTIPNDEIWYTTPDGLVYLAFTSVVNSMGLISNTYNNNKGIMKFSQSITSVLNSAFYHCLGLTSITLPNSVTTIGNYAFSYCSDLTLVTIGSSITFIGREAFYSCTNIKDIIYTETIAQWGKIYKDTSWKSRIPLNCVVHCTDGDLAILHA